MKTPDALSIAIDKAIDNSEGALDYTLGEKRDKATELYEEVSQWFKYGEYLICEFDTETKTARIVKP